MYILIRKSKNGKAGKEYYSDCDEWVKIVDSQLLPKYKEFKNKKEILNFLRENEIVNAITKVSDWEDEDCVYSAKKVEE